jgi:hypothetical protein
MDAKRFGLSKVEQAASESPKFCGRKLADMRWDEFMTRHVRATQYHSFESAPEVDTVVVGVSSDYDITVAAQ